MTIDEAITELTARIKNVSPDAVIRTQRRSAEEASIRAYAPVDHEAAIKSVTQEFSIALLMREGLDVQVLVYDIVTSLPPE